MNKNFAGRSSMQVATTTRLLGMTITLFILILTMKAELLEFHYVAWQLSLVIPILFASMVSNSKIIDQTSFDKYRNFNLVMNSVSIALIANTIGLLISKYVSVFIGMAYFILFMGVYLFFFCKDFKNKKFYNELIILILLFSFGIIPLLFVL
jgi:hypothetical protein